MAAFAKELRACLAEAEGAVAPPPAQDDLELTLVTPPAPAPPARAPARRRARPPARSRRRPLRVRTACAPRRRCRVRGRPAARRLGPRHGTSGRRLVGSAVQLHGLSGYDPQGDGGEHDELAGDATDGSTSTAWTTETYHSPDFGGLKTGVGLVLDAGGPVKLAQLTVTTPTPGFTAEIQAGGLAEWRLRGRLVLADGQRDDDVHVGRPDGARTTSSGSRSSPPTARTEISEVTARS